MGDGMAKKNPYRFCIQFDKNDINHQEVAMILNTEGRKAAQLIANAIIHYKSCSKTPDIAIDQNSFLLNGIEQLLDKKLSNIILKAPEPKSEKKLRKSAEILTDNSEINKEDAPAILNALNAFKL